MQISHRKKFLLKADVSSVGHSSKPFAIRPDKRLTLQTSAFESPNGGQFTLSIQMIKLSWYSFAPYGRCVTVSLETYPLFTLVREERNEERKNSRVNELETEKNK